jgi:hypothetical protein
MYHNYVRSCDCLQLDSPWRIYGTNLILISCERGIDGDSFFMPVLEHHILLPRCLDAYCEWHVVTCNNSANMYTRLFVVEHKMWMFLHPHAHRLDIIHVTFISLYCKVASDVTDVLVANEEVPSELLTSFTRFQKALPMFCHDLRDRQTQPQMFHDEFPNLW